MCSNTVSIIVKCMFNILSHLLYLSSLFYLLDRFFFPNSQFFIRTSRNNNKLRFFTLDWMEPSRNTMLQPPVYIGSQNYELKKTARPEKKLVRPIRTGQNLYFGIYFCGLEDFAELSSRAAKMFLPETMVLRHIFLEQLTNFTVTKIL